MNHNRPKRCPRCGFGWKVANKDYAYCSQPGYWGGHTWTSEDAPNSPIDLAHEAVIAFAEWVADTRLPMPASTRSRLRDLATDYLTADE